MIKGPKQIPIPEFLRNRDGHFLMTLRCRIAVDGGSRVEVMEGTGATPLDESVAQSFRNLPWYPAQLRGRSVEVTVRLIIETEWKAGESYIDWGGRVPKQDPIVL